MNFGIAIFWDGRRNCIMKNKKCIVFSKLQCMNLHHDKIFLTVILKIIKQLTITKNMLHNYYNSLNIMSLQIVNLRWCNIL